MKKFENIRWGGKKTQFSSRQSSESGARRMSTSVTENGVTREVGMYACVDGVMRLMSLDTSDATATAADIASGKTAYVRGEKKTGTGFVQSNSTPKTVTGSFETQSKHHYCKLIVTGNPSNGTVKVEVSVGLSLDPEGKWHEIVNYSI